MVCVGSLRICADPSQMVRPFGFEMVVIIFAFAACSQFILQACAGISGNWSGSLQRHMSLTTAYQRDSVNQSDTKKIMG